MQKRVFDCFLFFNELDLLDIRLHELYEKVDFFVLAEAPVTFKGAKKPLVFQENKARFAPFLDKIIHLIVDDVPEVATPWERERVQRAALMRGVPDPGIDDVIAISDADEIMRAETVDVLRENYGYFRLVMPMYQYFLNLRERHPWNKAFAFSYIMLEDIPDFSFVRANQQACYAMFPAEAREILDAGWHFTYLGGPGRIREKISAFSHDTPWFRSMLAPGAAERQIAAGFEVGNGVNFNRLCPIDDTYPKYIRENLPKFQKMGFIRDPYEALADLQNILTEAAERTRKPGKQKAG